MLARTGMLSDVTALGAYQINNVWAVTFSTAEATKKMLDSGEQEVKGRRCLIFDPQNQQVRLKLHWLLQGVDDEDVRTAFAAYGRVTEVTKERWRVQGVHDKGSTTRTVMLKLKAGVKLDDLPHQIRVAGELALVVAPGRPMQCLRCHTTGHVRRECKVPRCSRCRRFGHTDAQCVRTYANVTRPAGGDDQSELVMDAMEAEEAARGTGGFAAADGASSTLLTMEGNPPNSQEVQTGDTPTLQQSNSESAPTTKQSDAASVQEEMDVSQLQAASVAASTKRSHDEAEGGQPLTTHVNSEEPPAKSSQSRRVPPKPTRPDNKQSRSLPRTTSAQQQPLGTSELDPGGHVSTP